MPAGESKPPAIPDAAPDLDPDLVIRAYCVGAFPMAVGSGEIGWFSPDPRGVLPLDRFHVPHGLRRQLRKAGFELRFNTAFEDVVDGCAGREETWIDTNIRQVFVSLHRLGWAHSVETWLDGLLVGGLYGLAIRGAFFGESMFSRVSAASGAALVGLVDHLRQRDYALLDIQWTTGHLERFGAEEIPRSQYLARLNEALKRHCRFST